MEVESYDLFYLRIRDSLILSTDISKKTFVPSHFSSALLGCNSCVSKALELVTELLEDSNILVTKLCSYIDNIITLLQKLSDYIKNVVESAAMACCNMKPFPTTTGNIILMVFVHCKDSEWIYGLHLKLVETQLKDLFRTCHELQLTYLMALENNFIFDLTEKEEQEILIEALNINMKIGEIVQALDIKTMAEQWKAYTVICEKYSNFLVDKNIYNDITQLFATIIMNNIKTAMESEQDNKSTVRSLKVGNFTIKILSRMSNVFKHALTNNYEPVVNLMMYIYMHNPAYLEMSDEKTEQFINLVVTNILTPTEGLCNILIQDERFLDYISKIDLINLETNAFLGYIILITSIIKVTLQKQGDQVVSLVKRKLIDCVYRILPLGHYWFNMGLRFPSKDNTGNVKYFSLYEYLLVHVIALATTFSSELYALLEKYMFEAIMSMDCYSAMFSSNLWVLVIRTTDNNLISNTLFSLVNIYQKLEKHRFFCNSSQDVHLSYLIGKLFEISSSEDKRIMSKQIDPRNVLWSVLKVSNLPDPLRRKSEAVVLDNLKTSLHEFIEAQDVPHIELDNLIQVMKVAATCTFLENNDDIEQCVVKLWGKVCCNNEYIQPKDLDAAETAWYLEYLEALVSLTDSVALKLGSGSLGKILYSMSTLLHNCSTEITILLLDLFCKLTFNRIQDENQHVIDNIFKDTWKVLWQGVEACSKPYLLSILSKYKYNDHFDEITCIIFCNDESMRKEFNLKCDYKSSKWKHQLTTEARFEYIHKCRRSIKSSCDGFESDIQDMKSSFGLGGFIFDDDFDEPSRKKAKLDITETDSLIESLEKNTSLLCQVEHATLYNYKTRIAVIIDRLKNIVS